MTRMMKVKCRLGRVDDRSFTASVGRGRNEVGGTEEQKAHPNTEAIDSIEELEAKFQR